LIKELLKFDLGVILVVPEHIIACHPFVGKSFLHAGRSLYRDEDEEEEENTSEKDDNFGDNETSRISLSNAAVSWDRPRSFVINDEPKVGPASFYAVKSFRRDSQPLRCPVTAVAVRERGNHKYSKVLRFAYRVSPPLSTAIETWVAVPGCGLTTETLFVKRDDNGRICIPSPDSEAPKDLVERVVLANCVVLTVGQRCADWFVLRQFRVTGTNAGKFLMSDDEARTAIDYDITDNCNQLSEPLDCDSCDSRTSLSLLSSWFISSRSTEPMMRGSVNENALLRALRRKTFMAGLFEAGMIAKKGKEWLACSPDGIAILNLDHCTMAYNPFLAPSASNVPPWRSTGLGEARLATAGRFVLSSVEIKTSVSTSSLQRSTAAASRDVTLCTVGDQTFKELVPEQHVGQVLHQMIVLK
jgi:hypothetical protein